MLIITPLARLGDLAAERLILVEVVVHDRLALRAAHQAVPEAEQASGGDHELAVGVDALDVHPEQLAATGADEFHDRAHLGLGDVDDEVLERLVLDAVDPLEDDLGLADGQLVALAPHALDQDGEVQQARGRRP